MDDSVILKKMAKNFKVFDVLLEEDVEMLKNEENRHNFRKKLKNILFPSEINLKNSIRFEILCLLVEFCLQNGLSSIEICSAVSIFLSTLRLSFKKCTKEQVFEYFKNILINHSINRPPFQIGIFQKINVELLSDFFIENIYKCYELLKYHLTKRTNIIISEKEILEVSFPHNLDLNLGYEILPRHCKILKNYSDVKRPKTVFEQNIEMILEKERELLDVELEKKFQLQDEEFNKKVEELLKKKK